MTTHNHQHHNPTASLASTIILPPHSHNNNSIGHHPHSLQQQSPHHQNQHQQIQMFQQSMGHGPSPTFYPFNHPTASNGSSTVHSSHPSAMYATQIAHHSNGNGQQNPQQIISSAGANFHCSNAVDFPFISESKVTILLNRKNKF
jgi:hypothetical protein